jgi:hypothetical protein
MINVERKIKEDMANMVVDMMPPNTPWNLQSWVGTRDVILHIQLEIDGNYVRIPKR